MPPADRPPWSRFEIGLLLEIAALTCMFGVGRNAAAVGLTGRFGEPSMADLRAAHEEAALTEPAFAPPATPVPA